MKGKRIRIDWDDLEAAFNNKNEELVYYLDLVTGHVHLEGEGERDEFDDDDEFSVDAPAPSAARSDATRLVVEPPDDEAESGWMSEFVDSADDLDGELADRLRAALDDADPTNAFRDALREHAEERDRWFLYRSAQVHQLIDSWLDANQVQPLEPPPWS